MYLTVFPTDVMFSTTERPRPQSASMDLPQRLKQAIAETHDAIEALPVSKAILEGRISRATYRELLSQLWYVHADLERLLLTARDLVGLVERTMHRTNAIVADLTALEMDIAPIQPTTTRTLHAMRAAAQASPWAVLGCLYVLEGSRMGSMVLVKPLSFALKVELRPGCGLDYHLEGMESRPRDWAAFKGRLSALELDDDQIQHTLQGAQLMMQGLYAIYEAQSNATIACSNN
ncbi:MAG: biliverdin-producing heme oxygenase [Gemmataceae bacterium]